MNIRSGCTAYSRPNLYVRLQYIQDIQQLALNVAVGSFPVLAIFLIYNQSLRLSSGQLQTFTRRQAMTFGWQLYYRNRPTSVLPGY
jgi:hypothetical protein